MQTADREEFEAQMEKLCAGFNVPMTKPRGDAYFLGLSKMSLAQFARCVEHALGGDYPAERIPTTVQVWKIHKLLKSQTRTIVQAAKVEDTRDHLEYFANRMFLRHLVNREGLGSTGVFKPAYGMTQCRPSQELVDALAVKRALVEWFVGPIAEGDDLATPAEFMTQFMTALHKVSPLAPATRRGWQRQIDDPQSQVPFAKYMGRPYKSQTPVRTDITYPLTEQA